MARILVAEDDEDLRGLVCRYLSQAGHRPVACADGQAALEAYESGTFDMIITDVMMPRMDGFALAERVRAAGRKIPILFMTVLDGKPAQRRGYEIGADDYVVKPFDADILMMRVGALLRRADIERSRTVEAGNLRMDADEHAAYVDGREIPLTVREFDLLFKLLSFPKRTFTRSQLMDEFWDYDSAATSRTVDVYMARIREKTSACTGFEIQTVHGLGYRAVLL